jgi:hypothetical protein
MKELKDSDTWKDLFGNLDNLSVKRMIELRKKLEAEWKKLKLDPEALKAIRDELDKVTEKIEQKNPFKALGEAIKSYSEAETKEDKKNASKDIFRGIAASIDLVKGSFDAVIGGMEKMGITMDEETQAILEDIGGIMDGAKNLSEGIVSENPLQIIQGSIDILSNGIDLLFGSKDRAAEKSIKRHAQAVEELQRAYNALTWAIDKALGDEVYKNQQAAILNMKKQQQHLQQMWEAEQSKKKSDANRIADYKEQYAELGRQIEDMIDEISEDLLQTNAKSFADELGDALADAFAKGENAADAFGNTVNKVIKDIVLNQLKKNFLEKQLEGVLNEMESQMGYYEHSNKQRLEIIALQQKIATLKKSVWSSPSVIKDLEEQLKYLLANGDEYIFKGLTEAQIAAFRSQIGNISTDFNNAMEQYSDIFKDLGIDADTSLTGAIKGVTEETASIVAGQLNAMRINQAEANEALRQMLIQLIRIAQNTSYNHYLQSIDERLYRIENSDILRAQGLGG